MKGLMRTRLVSCYLAILGAAVRTPTQEPRGLAARVSKFNIVDRSFDDALRELALQSRSNLVVGFESAANSQGLAPKIRVAMESGTAGDTLALMCAADKRY